MRPKADVSDATATSGNVEVVSSRQTSFALLWVGFRVSQKGFPVLSNRFPVLLNREFPHQSIENPGAKNAPWALTLIKFPVFSL